MKLYRMVSLVMLGLSLIAAFVAMKKPEPVGHPMPIKLEALNAKVFERKLDQFEKPRQPGQTPAEVQFTGEEVTGELMEATGRIPASDEPRFSKNAQPVSAASQSPAGTFAPGQAQIKDYQISFEADITRGQFLTQIAGRDVYVTLAGHLGSANGYISFEPTEFKIGDLDIPISLVDAELQKKLAEQREQLKLPDNVGSIRVEDSQLVMTQKW